MMDVILCSLDFVRTHTNVSDNLSDKYLLSAVREAQDIDFQEIVGTALYKKLKSLVEDDEIMNDANVMYKDLLDVAKYFIAYKAIANLCVNTTFKISNIGVNTTTDDNVQIPYVSDVFKIKDYYINKADFYCKRLQDFILNNIKAFKEVNECQCHKMHSTLYSSATNALWLGGARGKGCHRNYKYGYDKD